LPCHLRPAHAANRHLHHNHVRALVGGDAYCLIRGGSDADDVHVWVATEALRQRLASHGVVIDDENADSSGRCHAALEESKASCPVVQAALLDIFRESLVTGYIVSHAGALDTITFVVRLLAEPARVLAAVTMTVMRAAGWYR
jgi:hypothetical protein